MLVRSSAKTCSYWKSENISKLPILILQAEKNTKNGGKVFTPWAASLIFLFSVPKGFGWFFGGFFGFNENFSVSERSFDS